jgi:hypothetical protein
MSWNTAGRIALFVNLALSLVFAFWGMAVYANRVDWSNQRSGDNVGAYARRDEVIKDLRDKEAPTAGAHWNAASPAMKELEARRPEIQKWYASDLENLSAGNKPVQALVVKKGVTEINPADGVPVLGPVLDKDGKPIQGLASTETLHQNFMQLQDQITQTANEIGSLVNAEEKLTTEIGDGREKGLRFDLAAEKLEEKKLLDEQEFLKPLLYNRQVEHDLLVKRQKELEARISKLRRVSLAKQPSTALDK